MRLACPPRGFLPSFDADTAEEYVGLSALMATTRALIDMPTPMHLRTLTAFKLSDDILPTRYRYPFKMRITTKIGLKNSEVCYDYLRRQPAAQGVLDTSGLNWFSGI
jgi:hypothetical protein